MTQTLALGHYPPTFAGNEGGGNGTFKVHLTKVPSQGALVRWYVAI